jgi:prepilin-type N-terminal cleavage/methylation domain-containing protein
MQRNLTDRPDDEGMSLVEVLVAMMIFAVISTGIIFTMLSMLSVTRDSRARQVALNLASEEVDDVRTTGDLFELLDANRSVQVNDTTYHVKRSTRWVTDPGQDLQCGTSGSAAGSTLRYKRVNVEVTWDNMRSQTVPVRSDTVVSPDSHLNDPTLGTILVSVLSGDGSGRPGVAVGASVSSPANGARPLTVNPAATDAQGCTYILKVAPGNYDIKVTRAGYVDHKQNPTGTMTVGVGPGASASAGFQYDQAAKVTTRLAANYVPAAGETVRFPSNLDTSFVSSYGTHLLTGGSTTATVFPFSSGYTVLAGKFVAPSDANAGCVSVDPASWVPGPDGAVTLGPPDATTATTRPGGASTVDVPMGVVKVAGAGRYLRATTAAPQGADPGGAVPMTYTFDVGGNANGASTQTIALPPGTWTIARGNAASSTAAVPAAQLTVMSRGLVAGPGTVLLDPRVEVAP